MGSLRVVNVLPRWPLREAEVLHLSLQPEIIPQFSLSCPWTIYKSSRHLLCSKPHSMGLSNFPQDLFIFGKNTSEVMLCSQSILSEGPWCQFVLFLVVVTFITWLGWCFPVFSIQKLILFDAYKLMRNS